MGEPYVTDLQNLTNDLLICYLIVLQDLDLRCEQLIKEEFGVECNFDVVDAVKKLEKLGIVSRVSSFFFFCKL